MSVQERKQRERAERERLIVATARELRGRVTRVGRHR